MSLLLTILSFVHILACIALILIVLLQTGKSADLASAFGGGASTTGYGSRSSATFLNKLTTISAVIFMCSSLGLAYLSSSSRGASVIPQSDTLPVAPQPGQGGPGPGAPGGDILGEDGGTMDSGNDQSAPSGQGAGGTGVQPETENFDAPSGGE